MSYNLVNPTTGALTRVSGNITSNIIPANASSNNKLVTNSDIIIKHNYSMAGTASLEDDIKTFVTALIALGANTYAGFFNRGGNLGTAGNYSITVYAEEGTSTFASGYIVLGAGAMGRTQYEVSYYKPAGSSEEWAIKEMVATSDTFIVYSPNTSDYSTWAEVLEMLHQKGTGLWCGKVYLDAQWWYYTANIQIGSQGYWLGSGTFKSADNSQLRGANKAYNTSTTWDIAIYATKNDLPVKYLYVDGTTYATLNDLLAFIIASIGQIAPSNGSAGVFNGIWTGRSHFSVQWTYVEQVSASSWNGWFSITLENAQDSHSIYSISVANSTIVTQRVIV